VRLFTEWASNIDSEADKLLRAAGWQRPNDADIPFGGELLRSCLQPLADHPESRPHLRLGHRVVAVSRRGFDKVKTDGRTSQPFVLQISSRGEEKVIEASAVIDASGISIKAYISVTS
jgi:hypothetical protein